MATSNATEEQRRALREELKRQIADMRALQAAAEVERKEQQDLLARIAAMESKVGELRGRPVQKRRSHCQSCIACLLVCRQLAAARLGCCKLFFACCIEG